MPWTVDNIPIVQLDLEVPSFGAWWAYVTTEAQPSSGGMMLGSAEWVGSIRAQRADGRRWRTFIVGGAGGLNTELPHRQVRGPAVTVQTVAERICALAGETLGGAPATPLATYHRTRGTAGAALSALAAASRLSWRVDRAGVVQFFDPASGVVPEPAGTQIAGVYSGRRFSGLASIDVEPTAGHVRASVMNGAATMTVYDTAIEEVPAPRIEGVFGGRVVAQSGALVDLRVDETWDLASVPLFVGLPGVHVELAAGARVLVTYLDQDPRRPVAMLAPDGDPAAVTYEIGDSNSDLLLAGGHATVVREGDIVTVGVATGPVVLSSPPGSPATLRSKVKA